MYYRPRDESDPKGRTRFFESYKDPVTGKKRVVSVILDRNTTQTRKTAQRILAEKIKQRIAESTKTPETDLTLGEVTERFLTALEQEGVVRDSTIKAYRMTSKKLLEVIEPDTPINTLTAVFINDQLRSSGNSTAWINRCAHRLKHTLKWANQNGYLQDSSLISGIKTYTNREAKEKLRDKYLEPEELELLLESMDKDCWRYVTLVLALSGLRIGELIALDVSDITYDTETPRNAFISVRKTCYDGVIYQHTKTESSSRDIFIQPELEDILEKIKKWREEKFGNTNILIPQFNGKRINYSSYNAYLKKRSREVLGRTVTAHALRHTHTSLLAEKGVPLEVISRRLGHEDSDITRKIYLHVTKGVEESDRALLRKISLL